MNPIIKALSQGYTASQIIKYLTNSFPAWGKSITNAQSQGYSPEQILKYLSGDKNSSDDSFKAPSEIIAENDESTRNNVKTGLKVAGGLALGAGGALANAAYKNLFGPSGAPAAAQALGAGSSNTGGTPISPNNPTNPAAPIAPTPPVGGQATPAPTPPIPAVNPVNPGQPTQVAQPPNATPQIPATNNVRAQSAQPAQMPMPNTTQLFDQMGLSKQIKQMASTNSPEDVAAVIEKLGMISPEQKKWLQQQTNVPLPDLIRNFLAESGNQAENGQVLPEVGQNSPIPEINDIQNQAMGESYIDENRPSLETKSESIQENVDEKSKGKTVILPDGQVGNVLSEKNGIATIDVDGVKKTRKLDDLEDSPIEEKDLAQLYEDLKLAIPESERSGFINWAGYDEDSNELAVRPHDGPAYVYKNVPEQFIDKLKNVMFQAKTTGENFYGSWTKGEKSRGAGISALIKELEEFYGRGNAHVRKYKTVHDFLALPEKAKKQKKRNESQEIARKKQQAKDEENERKKEAKRREKERKK